MSPDPTQPSAVHIVLLDDHPVVRAGLRSALEGVEGISIVAEAASIDEVISAVENEQVDVALVDLNLGGGGTGQEAIERIVERSPRTRCLVVTAFDNEMDIRSALSAGAIGYVLKDAPAEELVAAVLGAARGERPLSAQVASRLVFGGVASPDTLTERELEVLGAVAQGRDNASIGRELFISQATVKSHLNRVFTKLQVSTRTGAVAEARRRGLLR